MTEKQKYKLFRPFVKLFSRYPKQVLGLRYLKNKHKFLNLKNPTDYQEKIQWLAFNTDTAIWTELTDKYEVRKFVKNRCGESVLNQLYGVWQCATEIDFAQLPSSFVLKTNNGCGTNLIVRDKSIINKSEIVKMLDNWLSIPYGELTGQPHYTRIKPRIIAEQLLIQDEDDLSKLPLDYKFICFNGQPYMCLVYRRRKLNTHDFETMAFDENWIQHPEILTPNERTKATDFQKPICYEAMWEIASKLSAGFPHVRVDLYCINDHPVFGEMTFTPSFQNLNPDFQSKLASFIDLSKLD